MAAIRVALVNDYEVVVRGLEAMLRTYVDRIQVVELDASRDVARSVDIAMYDTFAGQQGDREEIRQLISNPRVSKVVVYSWNLQPDLVRGALHNGAAGYLSKSLPAGELVAALEAVHVGDEQVVPHDPHPGKVITGDWPGREEGLTPREAEVLALITQGLNNQEIADRTRLSINSVKTYIRGAYRRIGVTTRTNAVLWGVEHGFHPDRARMRPRE
ncbi:response regulator transcription factor [Flexivirga caeni]|uniref:DNA-binding response regulator n=1 Tax=Flexivirga caeni TaxID=2294115 RepID=A0A3M9M2W2_9MICO|nr:response regulator transcription factor [Flexivirga caeni]RNI19914.1 DNA-binding response regulator [Flexivirga caeni]